MTTLTPLPQVEHVWSRYENPNRGFTFEYPSDVLTPREGDATEPSVVFFERSSSAVLEGIQISSQKTDYLDATSYYSQYPKMMENLISTTVAGLPALKQLDTQYPITTLFFVHSGRIYTMTLSLSPADLERVQQSFRFK